MPQLHFYVPDDVAEKIRQEARIAEVSVSRYLADLVKRELISDWPEDYFRNVVGGWHGEQLTRPPQGDFEDRDPIDPEPN